MPRYFFALHDHGYEPDEVGVELPDLRAARVEAIRYVGEVLRDEPALLDHNDMIAVLVTDETGNEALRLEIRALGPDT